MQIATSKIPTLKRISTAVVSIGAVIGLVVGSGGSVAAASTVVYDALPSVSPDTSYPSQPFQAQQTSEFGDKVHLGGTARDLSSVTVTMVTWAPYSEWSSDARYTDADSWNHPVTLNVYDDSVTGGVPDTLLATTTEDVSIPWRPAGDPTCPTYTPTSTTHAWRDSTGTCNFGYAFNATFDLSTSGVTLPDDVIIGVAYNTNTWGYAPIGQTGPYDSLNVAVPPSQPVSVGEDADTDAVFWNTKTAAWYTDGGAAGSGIFREDDNWTPYGTVAFRVSASMPTKEDCKNGGWKTMDKEFKNQGQCVSYMNHQNGNGNDDVVHSAATATASKKR